MSRSVTTPTSRSLSQTGTTPTSRLLIVCAASIKLASGLTTSGLFVITSLIRIAISSNHALLIIEMVSVGALTSTQLAHRIPYKVVTAARVVERWGALSLRKSRQLVPAYKLCPRLPGQFLISVPRCVQIVLVQFLQIQ